MEEKKRLPVIITPFGSKQKIAKEVSVSRDFVSKSLNYTSNSEKAKKIRSIALEKYGGFESYKEVEV
ncbi:hypothetical protein [Parabacteroides merdae]|jgi:hypothetical protein|uniref:Uncharacterized protein n=1 Tax=Parabacteroides merdae TaxID=46503 RepID=A0A414XJC2_9BACT|nr:hypothetical protein [Parabacteroides merdae]RHH73992.1 hypothetical protein DW191_19030 [Parabacteroides merdae]